MDKWKLHHGDCLQIMQQLKDEQIQVHSIVTDPPYHLASIVSRFGKEGSAPTVDQGVFRRSSTGFMGKEWDGGDIAFKVETWKLCYDLLLPGGHLVAFAATKNYHRMACAIEDAGFEIRDQLGWLYGTGFPKSHDISKQIDKMYGAKRKVINTFVSHSGGLMNVNKRNAEEGFRGSNYYEESGNIIEYTEPTTDDAKQWKGWGTVLKPAWEPICLARKPLSENTIAKNVLKYGTGAINIDDCRIGNEIRFNQSAAHNEIYGQFEGDESTGRYRTGRWPANVIHDGSDEVINSFPNDASRFFYSAKASKTERFGSKHPTVKPVLLMRYLTRLITPKNGIILDPFAGSGTTLQAGVMEGFKVIGIEKDQEYIKDIQTRMNSINDASLDDLFQ